MSTRGRPARRRNRGRRVQRQLRTPSAVINLDGASSSSNEDDDYLVTHAVKSKDIIMQHPTINHITLSPDKMSRGIMSGSSSDSDCDSADISITHCSNPKQIKSDHDNNDDIFDMNYSAHFQQALRGAYKEITLDERGHNQALQPKKKLQTPNHDEDCTILDDPSSTPKRKMEDEEILECPPSPTLFEINKNKKVSKRNTRRTRNNEVAVFQEESSESPKISAEESFNLSCDILTSDEEDVNPEIRLCIKWGTEVFRSPIRKLQKFAHLYEVLAKKYGVNINCIVLNFNDKIINPSLCPADFNMTIADVIDGGVVSSQIQHRSISNRSAAPKVTPDPNAIQLRLQSADKKGSITLSIGPTEKMIVLMHKYAEEKRTTIDQLKFLFDGEEISPSSTVASLDLEGGECIDVFKH